MQDCCDFVCDFYMILLFFLLCCDLCNLCDSLLLIFVIFLFLRKVYGISHSEIHVLFYKKVVYRKVVLGFSES